VTKNIVDPSARLAAAEKRKAHQAAWRKRNPQKVRAYSKAWAAQNPEKRRANKAAWRKGNPEKARASTQAWRAQNPESVKAYLATRKKRDPQKAREAYRAWEKRNLEKVRARQEAWAKHNPEKRRAHNRAIAIPLPETCQRCGARGKLHRHHPDYGKPLMVEFLCASCHTRLHWELRRRARTRRWRLILEDGTVVPTALALESRP
jgi:hypothetical protein